MDVKLEYDAGIQSSGDSWKYKHEREFYDGWCCAAVYDEVTLQVEIQVPSR